MAETADPRQGILESVSKHRAQIMGFAAMWIFVFHVRNEILLFDNLPKWSFLPYVGNVDIYFDNIGFNGVDMFLFLSGWGLYHAIKKHSLLVFYKRRYRRLILPFIAASLIPAVYYRWDILRLVKAVTGWTFLTKDVLEPKWFVPAIALMYLFFPLYYWLFEKVPNKYILTAAAVVLWTAVSFVIPLVTSRTDISGPVGRIPVFIIGVFFGWLTFNGKELGKASWIVILILLVLGFQAEYYVCFEKAELLNPTITIGLPGMLIAPSMCFITGYVFMLLDRIRIIQKAYRFMGLMTLEFYCVQDIIIFVRDEIRDSGAQFERHLFVLVVFVLCLGFGYLLYLVNTLILKKADGKAFFEAKETGSKT